VLSKKPGILSEHSNHTIFLKMPGFSSLTQYNAYPSQQPLFHKLSWGDRHFAIEDPNGIGIDIVHYQAPDEK
jgi:hypothetical protein